MSILPTQDRVGGRGEDGDDGRSGQERAAAEAAVTALYREHALGLTRLAQVMLGDRATAEDVVQEAFAGLFRRWAFLDDAGKAPQYLRSAVLNRCRNVRRRGAPHDPVDADAGGPAGFVAGVDTALLEAEERRAVLAALRTLPARQREALVLRYFLDLPDEEIARSMGIRPGTVRSAVHRGLAALERAMREGATR